MSDKAKIVVLTGPSGFVNKTVLINGLLEKSDKFAKVISYTDRPARENEVDGRDFNFTTEDEFTEMIEREDFLEWQLVHANGHRFGKTKADMARTVAENPGKFVLTIVNIINYPVFKRYYPDNTCIFIDVKDNLKLIEYLRNSPEITDEEEYEKRYKYATEERRRRHLADYIINMKDGHEDVIEEIMRYLLPEENG